MLDYEGYVPPPEAILNLNTSTVDQALNAPLEDLDKPLNIEDLHASEKVKGLIREFRLQEPKLVDYQDIRGRLEREELPMVKAVSVPIARALFTKGELRPASEVEVDNREGVYTSLVIRKDYGPIALVFKPEVLGRRNFTGYAVDHVGNHVTDQDKLRTPSSHKAILQKYMLTPKEYFTFFAYAAASIMSHPPWDWTNETDETTYEENNRLLEQICCDITLPMVRPQDVAKVIITIDGYFEEHTEEELDQLIASIKTFGIPLIAINGKSPSSNYPGEMEETTTEQILAIFAHDYNIPPEIIKAIRSVA